MRVRLTTQDLLAVNLKRVGSRVGNVKLQQFSDPRLQAFNGDLLESESNEGSSLNARSVQIVHAFLHRAPVDALRRGSSRETRQSSVIGYCASPAGEIIEPTEVRQYLDFTDGRSCPICSKGVRRGITACKSCGHEFRGAVTTASC